MKNGFDKNGFMSYLQRSYWGFENSMFRGTVENIIDHGLKHERVSKDQFCYFVSDLIEEVSFREVAAFIDDGSLTAWGLDEKRKAIAEMKENNL